MIADQIPSRLAPDVVKNTTLKIAHRTVSLDDRTALGGAMAMDDEQARALDVAGRGGRPRCSVPATSSLRCSCACRWLEGPARAPRSPRDDAVASAHGAAGARHRQVQRNCSGPARTAPLTCAVGALERRSARRLAADEQVQRGRCRAPSCPSSGGRARRARTGSPGIAT